MGTLKSILELLFWMVVAGATLFGIALLFGLMMAPVIGFVGIAVGLILIPMSLRVTTKSRERRAAMVLAYVEQAVRLNLPLPRMLWAAQMSEKGKNSVRLMNVRERIEDGLPIGVALEMGAPEVPDRAVALVAAAERVGRLPHALRRVAEEEKAAAKQQVTMISFYRIYPGLMILVVAVVLTLLSIFVVPKFQAIFRDFNIQLPPITVRMYQVASEIAPIACGLVALVLMWFASRTLWKTFHPGRSRNSVIRNVIDAARWWMPIWGALDRDRGLADTLDVMAEGLDAGVSADRAIAAAATLRLNVVLKDRVMEWARGVSQGLSIHDAARRAWLPPLVWGMLGTATRNDDAANTCRFLSRYYGARFSRLAMLVQAAMVPIIVLIFGAIVLCVAMSLFIPMTNLIRSMAVMPKVSM